MEIWNFFGLVADGIENDRYAVAHGLHKQARLDRINIMGSRGAPFWADKNAQAAPYAIHDLLTDFFASFWAMATHPNSLQSATKPAYKGPIFKLMRDNHDRRAVANVKEDVVVARVVAHDECGILGEFSDNVESNAQQFMDDEHALAVHVEPGLAAK